jgi:predicted Zn-dependent protease
VVSRAVSGDRRDEALALADDVLARATAAGASEVEALVIGTDSALTRFANSEIHQNVAESSLRINLRFVAGRRVAVASSGRTDADGLAALVERAAAIARTCEPLEDWCGLPAPEAADEAPEADARRTPAWSAGTAEATPEFRAAGVRAVIAAADAARVTAYGAFSTDSETVAVANSSGIRAVERRTAAQLVTVHMSPDGGTGYAERVAMDATTIDPDEVGEEAAGRARASDGALELEPGDYPVVLEPYAMVDVLDTLAYLGFSGLAVLEGRSFAEPGRRIGSDLVTILDDAADPAGLPAAFDYEGVTKRRVVLVDRGACVDVVHDAQTAKRSRRHSTGHAFPAPNPYGPFAANMLMGPGRSTRDELIAGIERGLLVTRFWYTNPVHPKLAIVTGMTRDGLFLIEDGRVGRPVRNLRFTQSYLDALGAVSAVGAQRMVVRGLIGAAVVPAVRIDAWTFTGTTEH